MQLCQDEFSLVLSYLSMKQKRNIMTLCKNVYTCHETKKMLQRKQILDYFYDAFAHVFELKKNYDYSEKNSLNLNNNSEIYTTIYFAMHGDALYYQDRVFTVERTLQRKEKIINIYMCYGNHAHFPEKPDILLDRVNMTNCESIQNLKKLLDWLHLVQRCAVLWCYGCESVYDPCNIGGSGGIR